jgi:hypothetical protein
MAGHRASVSGGAGAADGAWVFVLAGEDEEHAELAKREFMSLVATTYGGLVRQERGES